MTTILLDDSGVLKCMTYVPEEPKYCIGFTAEDRDCLRCNSGWGGGCEDDKIKYQSALEKAKRDSVPFENQDLALRHLQASVLISKGYSSEDLISPGIYQVPVEVEVVHCQPCQKCDRDCYNYQMKDCKNTFARIKQKGQVLPEKVQENFIRNIFNDVDRLKSSEPKEKEESQEELWRELIDAYDLTDQSSYGYGSLIKKLSSLFTITRKRG